MNRIRTIIAAVLMLAVTACATVESVLNDNSLLAGVAAYKATTEIIERAEDPQARAKRILIYTEAAANIVDSAEPVTLQAVYEAVFESIAWDQIPPADRPLIEDLLSAIRDRLAEEVEQFAILTPETEVSLLHVISRIRSAAGFYANEVS